MDGQQIQAKLREAAAAKIRNYPCNNLRASEIGHPCERYLVLSITNWEDKKAHDVTLQNIFELGNAIESEVIRRIKEAGYELLTGGKNFKIQTPLITGREDIMLKDPETFELYPCEIKGLAPATFDKINTVSDMLNNRHYYVRKYPAQLQIYLLNYNKENGFFILFNKVTGEIKVIDVELDYDYAENLLRKAEHVYGHIIKNTLPDTIDDESVCSDCSLLHICGSKIDKGDAIIDDGELETLLLKREMLLTAIKELDDVKEQISRIIGNSNKAFTASYMVTMRTVNRKAYTVKEAEYRQMSVKRII